MAVSAFAADAWKVCGRPYPVRSIIPYGDGVLLATASGVRYVTPELDVLFSTVSGLETSSFYALALCDAGIFAVSEYGLIAGWNMETLNWNIANRCNSSIHRQWTNKCKCYSLCSYSNIHRRCK